MRRRVGVEVNNFTIGEANSEPLFDEHVPFFFLSKGTLPSTAAPGSGLLLGESGLVVDQLGSFGEVDGRSRLVSGFVVSGQLGADKLEESASPVLKDVSKHPTIFRCSTYRTITALLTQMTLELLDAGLLL